jgi:outer membrane murein-binding lipoprotein Lpp
MESIVIMLAVVVAALVIAVCVMGNRQSHYENMIRYYGKEIRHLDSDVYTIASKVGMRKVHDFERYVVNKPKGGR